MYLCCSWVTCFYSPKSFQVVSELACPIPLLSCFPLWGFGLGHGVDSHSFSPFPWRILRESSFLCQLFCSGISSVTGVAAFSEVSQRCLCFACSFRADEPLDSPSQFLFKKGKHTVSAPFAAWKVSIFQSSMQDLRPKPFEKHCLQWDVPQWVWSCTRQEGMVFAPSPLCCGLVSSCTSSQSYPMFLFKAGISALSKPSTQPDELVTCSWMLVING